MTKTLSPSTPAGALPRLLPPIPFALTLAERQGAIVRDSGDTWIAPKLVLAVYPAPFVLVICGRDSLFKEPTFKKILTSLETKFQVFSNFAKTISL